MKNCLLSLSLVFVCSALPSFASSSLCDATAGNIVANCGFEAGTYSSTINGSTNASVPVDWTPNAGYDAFGYNFLSSISNSGTYSVQIGNYTSQPEPTLSQTLTDVSGATYNGSVFVRDTGFGNNDPLPFFNVQIDGVNLISLNSSAPDNFAQYTFSFTGSGTDVLSFGGNTNAGEWYVDDFTVTEGAGPIGVTPEPSTLLLLATTGGPLFFLRQRLTGRA